MLRRPEEVAILVWEHRIAIWRRACPTDPWDLLDVEDCGGPFEVNDAADAAKDGGAIEDARWSTALRASARRLAARAPRPRVEVVLGQRLCPGMVVDLGERPAPRSVREALARYRFQVALAITPPEWRIQLDARAVVGSALAFAVRAQTLREIKIAFTQAQPKHLRIVPELVWASDCMEGDTRNGWLVLDSGYDTTSTRIVRGAVSLLEVGPSAVNRPRDWIDQVVKIGLMQGVDSRHDEIAVVELGAMVPQDAPGAKTGRQLYTHRLAALERSRAEADGLPQGARG